MAFPNQLQSLKLRYYLVIGCIVAVFLLFFWRAFELTFYSPLPPSVISPPPPVRRGIIFDSQNHELAVSRDTAAIAIRTEEVVNHEQTALLLSRILKIPKTEILSKMKDSEKKFVYLSRRTKIDDVEEIRALNLPGVQFIEEPDRYYPNHRLASSVLGFTGLDNEGLAGIEFQYDQELRHSEKNSYVGRNVHLTINAFIQFQLEKSLRSQFEKVKAKSAVGIISETATGKILAMASLPDFDPNRARDFSPAEQRNRAISDVYEPGSTFKIFTLAALVRENLLDENRTYFCPGSFQYKSYKVGCSGKHGEQSLAQVIAGSCNTGIIAASWEMPVLRFYENLRLFGFGSLTEITLPAEARGMLPPPKDWDIYLKMTIPIGHGLSVTPLQLIAAANAIANGGQYVRPIIVEKITSPDGKIIENFDIRPKIKVSDSRVGNKVLKYLEKVVESGTGTAARLQNDNLRVCGKTGTSIKSDKTGYLKNRYQASFLGFFPCDKPEVSILIMFDEPQGALYQGGQVAAPVFRNVLQEIIPNIHSGELQQVPPLPALDYDRLRFNPTIMPDLRGKSKKEVLQILWRFYPGEHELTGRGYVREQYPAPGTELKDNYRFVLRFDTPRETAKNQ